MNKQLEMRKACVESRKEGLTYKEIGKRLGITRDMVAGHLFRARKAAMERGLTDGRRIVPDTTQG